jgi:hypothetical protein
MTDPSMHTVSSRREMIRFFDGYSLQRKDELEQRKTKRPLVKSYLLEILDGARDGLTGLFGRRGMTLRQTDDDLYQARNEAGELVGFLEALRPRLVALYSTWDSNSLATLTRNLVLRSPEIDHVWLSGLTFNVLWDVVKRLSQPNRFARIVFTHDSVYEVDGVVQPSADTDEESSPGEEPEASEDVQVIAERRAARFQLVDRVRIVSEKLTQLQQTYSPLYAISQLRFPSPVGRGGHDFYDNGKVTNRSESFRDHRSHLLFVLKIYEEMLHRTERQARYGVKTSTAAPGEFRRIVGAPLVVEFSEPLEAPVFDYWIQSTFSRQRNRFRLWGHPIRLGPTKVHVYGLDRHLWHPLFLEFTARRCLAIIPDRTCGNTIHRLVTNIQRFIDPGAKAYLGDEPYTTLVRDSSRNIEYVDAA